MKLVLPEELEREQIRETLKDLAEYYEKSLTDRQLELYVDDLMPMGAKQTLNAALKYRRFFGHDKFPLPVQLCSSVGFYHEECFQKSKYSFLSGSHE